MGKEIRCFGTPQKEEEELPHAATVMLVMLREIRRGFTLGQEPRETTLLSHLDLRFPHFLTGISFPTPPLLYINHRS